MLLRSTAPIILFFALLTAACGSQMSTPDIKQNPHPVKRYEITMTLGDAPGVFDAVKASMGFQIANADTCAPRDPISGATPTPSYYPDITLNHTSDGVYKGIFYLDFTQDEDYYGKGICHWEFVAVNVTLENHGVTFASGLVQEAIVSGKTITEYMPKKFYFGSKNPGLNVVADYTPEEIAKRPSDYFTITLVAKSDAHE